MAEQYNVSPDVKRSLEQKAKRRLVLRNEFLKQYTDPYKHASEHGGTVFDPAMQRFLSMRITTFEHFKPNFKNFATFMVIAGIPFFAYGYAVWSSRTENERRYRSGEVAYKDRLFKFI